PDRDVRAGRHQRKALPVFREARLVVEVVLARDLDRLWAGFRGVHDVIAARPLLVIEPGRRPEISATTSTAGTRSAAGAGAAARAARAARARASSIARAAAGTGASAIARAAAGTGASA